MTGGTCLKILLARFPVEPTKNYVQAILIRHNGDKNVILFTSRFCESLVCVGKQSKQAKQSTCVHTKTRVFMQKHCVLFCMMDIVSISSRREGRPEQKHRFLQYKMERARPLGGQTAAKLRPSRSEPGFEDRPISLPCFPTYPRRCNLRTLQAELVGKRHYPRK